MRMRARHPGFTAVPRRVLLEVAGLMLGLGLLTPLLGSLELARQSVMLVIMPLGALVAAVRLRLPDGLWWQQLLREGRDGLLIGGLLFVGSFALLRLLLRDAFFQLWPLREAPATIFAMSLGGIAYLVFRSSLRFWLIWDRLRRQRLRWTLTHAQLSVVAAVALMVAVLIVGTAALRDPLAWGEVATANPLSPLAVRLLMNVLPMLAVAVVGTLLALLIVLPPAALISFLVARQTTRRVEYLAAAAEALRDGAYSTRVAVGGEDELARLQHAFNAMAAQLEQSLAQLQTERDRVAELLEARRQLMATVSHELRTPVTTVRGYLETSLERWDHIPAAQLRSDLEIMAHETQRLQRLIDDLFMLARNDAGGLKLLPGPVDVVALVQRVAATAAPLAWQTARVSVLADVIAQPGLALADEARLEQCLVNLVRNGIRHTPPGGLVVLSVAAEAEGIVISVRDTGEGIPAEELPQIWQPFYRGARSRQHDAGGAGLGLALVHDLTTAMGGTVAVTSTPGEGSVFRLGLPAAKAPVAAL